MSTRLRQKRIPKLAYTETRGIGWHVSYRDPTTGQPRKHRFGTVPEAQARLEYHRWLVAHLEGKPYVPGGAESEAPEVVSENVVQAIGRARGRGSASRHTEPQTAFGCLAEIATSYIKAQEMRVRPEGTRGRVRGTITRALYLDRSRRARQFLEHINERHGKGAAGRVRVVDLSMEDVESYDRKLAAQGLSDVRIKMRMQVVKGLIDRAGRHEHGLQRLAWNWDSRDVARGKPRQDRTLPTLEQLKALLNACDLRERTIIWIGIGLGFGQRDIAAIRTGQIDEVSYDLRRGKTGIERYGSTPPLVWAHIQAYVEQDKRKLGELMFTTRNGYPLVHGHTDSIGLWWAKLRKRIGESATTLQGFYILRHLGATEFGSRPSCSISEMRRWLGHSTSSTVADVYMRPVAPEHRELIEWVRSELMVNGFELNPEASSL